MKIKFTMILLLSVLFANCNGDGEDKSEKDGAVIEVGSQSPPSLPLLMPVNKAAIEYERVKGQPGLNVFWATWCLTCVRDLPTIKTLRDAFPKVNYQLIAVMSNPELVRSLIEVNEIESLPMFETPLTIDEIGIMGTPTYILYDPQAKEIWRKTQGMNWDNEASRQIFADALQGKLQDEKQSFIWTDKNGWTSISEKYPDVVVVDVRQGQEWDEGHIEGAILIPLDQLEARYEEIPTDKPVLLYCKSGGRSTQAANLLSKRGYTNLYNLKGGYTFWAKD